LYYQQLQIRNLAPSEGHIAKSVMQDDFAEEMAFPTLFGGQKRVDNTKRSVPLHYSDIVNSELQRRDRRFAAHVPNIFFKVKKQQLLQVVAAASVRMRKTAEASGARVTASQVSNATHTCLCVPYRSIGIPTNYCTGLQRDV
jgi:hypothetical protein